MVLLGRGVQRGFLAWNMCTMLVITLALPDGAHNGGGMDGSARGSSQPAIIKVRVSAGL